MSSASETNAEPREVAGLLAEFDSPAALKAAAERLRNEGYRRWDVHSPFPVHGIGRAMGMRPTPLPWLVLGAGIAGGLAALAMQWWMNAVDFPLVISGKPLFSLPANIPVAFELIVLFSALAAFGGAMALCRLPQFSHFALTGSRFRRVTTDGFFVSIEAADPKFEESATRALVESLGPSAVEVCYDVPQGRRFPKAVPWTLGVVATLALVPPLLVAWDRQVKSSTRRVHPVPDMDHQPKYKAQAISPLFEDRRTMRPAVPGTVAEGELADDDHYDRGKVGDAWADTFPMTPRRAMMQRGRQRYDIYCATCHGFLGDAQGMTSIRALKRLELEWRTPAALGKSSVRRQPVGQLFNTITNGLDKMPAYAPQIPVDDRWAIVLYVRALQRSQNAGVDDVPEEMRAKLR